MDSLDPSALRELFSMFAPLLGAEGVNRIQTIATTPEVVEALKSPATFAHELRTEINTILDRRANPDDRVIETWTIDAMHFLAGLGRQFIEDPEDLAGSLLGRTVFELACRARDATGPGQVVQCVWDAAAPLTWRTLNAMMALIRATVAPPGGFEDDVRRTATAIKDVVGLWYEPLLICLYRMHALTEGRQVSSASVLGEAARLLKSAGLGVVLDDQATTIRHAEAHGGLDIDVILREVSFINRLRTGRTTVLGPWTIEILRAAANDFLKRCMTISGAIVTFVVDEIDSAFAETTRDPEGGVLDQ